MKLNPEDLDVMSFTTDPGAELAQAVIGTVDGAAVVGPYRPLDPTPNSRCFVCDYT